MALFKSTPYDGIYFEANGSHPQSYVEYAVTPPQFATSLGFLAMGVIVCNGTGAFNDFGSSPLRATVTYADGDTSIHTLHVGTHVREYFDRLSPATLCRHTPLHDSPLRSLQWIHLRERHLLL